MVLKLHRTLLIPYGHHIITCSTIIFLFMLISGLILWWPKNKRTAKHGYKIKWNASPKRLNYDLHKVLGFYASWLLIFSALTGLMWASESFADAVYKITGSSRSIVQTKPPQSDTVAVSSLTVAPIDAVWYRIEKELYHNYATAMFVLPATKTDPILLRANPEKETLYKTDFRYLVNGKKDATQIEPYTQVFDNKHGFINNLSILDLLFNEGRYAVEYLKQQHL